MKLSKFTLYDRPCPVCDSAKSTELYANPDFRYISAVGRIYEAPLRYVICENCTHIYKTPNIDTKEMQELYRNHNIENPGAIDSNRLKKHYRAFSNMMDQFICGSTDSLDILEIGCGNGALINNIYQNYGSHINSIRGIEPSTSLYHYLTDKGQFEYENCFFEDLDLNQTYDLIILDNVFEHFDRPFDDLIRLKQILATTGILYISIPNIRINLSGYVDMFAGHPSNYLLENFTLIMERAGFYVAEHAFNDLWLNCVVRHKQPGDTLPEFDLDLVKADLLKLVKSHFEFNRQFLEDIRSRLTNMIQTLMENNEKMVIFGAGNHTQELLSHINFKTSICCLIDNDEELQGQSRLGYPVIAPTELHKMSFEKVLISSKSFQEEMLQNLLSQGIERDRIICLYE